MLSIRQLISRRLMRARLWLRFGDGAAQRFIDYWFRSDRMAYQIQLGD